MAVHEDAAASGVGVLVERVEQVGMALFAAGPGCAVQHRR